MPEKRRTIKPHESRPGSRRTPLIAFGPRGVAYEVHPEASEMHHPSQCLRCGLVYDRGHVTVTARYADCDMWKCPGCKATHDSRHQWADRARPGEHMGYIDLTERDRILRGSR